MLPRLASWKNVGFRIKANRRWAPAFIHDDRAKERPKESGNVKHVVVLSQFYLPEPFLFPPTIAEELSKHGIRVSVVTGYPNRPGGNIYPGYNQRLKYSERINGILVHRTPMAINHSTRALERILNFLTFSLGALVATNEIKDADAVYVYATPATAAIPAQIWRMLFGIPYVLHVQDLWPESVTGSGMVGKGSVSRMVAALLEPWLKRLYTGASALIAISPGMRRLLVERGSEADSCSVVYNWADESTVTPRSSRSFSEDGVRLLYAGNLGPMQDLETVMEAARVHENDPNFNLTIAGGGILEEALRAKSAGQTATRFLGRLSRPEVNELYLESDFQLVTLKDIPIFRTNVPSKLQASLAAGVPVITTVKGDVANLINQHDAGIVAEPDDSSSLAAAFSEALRTSPADRARMGRNARQLYEEQMSRSAGTSAIVSIIGGVIRKGTRVGFSESSHAVDGAS